MNKKLILPFLFSFALTTSVAQTPTITESAGWIESAFVKWQPVEGAESYNVYYSGEGVVEQKIDAQLIRDYGDYFRADVLGLKAGSYTLRVVPVISDEEGEGAETETLTVKAHDRTGFAFSNGRVPGAYKADGTPKDGAVILYISENTKNTITMDVTGANENPCVGLQTILEGFKKGADNRPLIVRLIGQITDLDYMNKGDIVIENDNNASGSITFEGVGDDAVADGWGIRVKNASNIEIRNIGLMNCDSNEGDNIGLQQNNDHIWVHHCDFFYGDAGSDSDQAKGDGALDCKKSTYVTFSYNHFWDSGKSNLLGLGEGTTTGYYITYHHNWYDHSDSRHPRVRYYSAHVYNNYYDGNSKYGVGSTMGSSVFVENNYFKNCKYPMLTSMQGSDVYDESKDENDYSDKPTFSKEDGGTIKAYNNHMEGEQRFVPYGSPEFNNSTVDFDAYVADSRDEVIGSSVVSSYGDNTYNNFDTDGDVMYDYSVDSPEEAKENVMAYAGRMFGGDFEWSFNNASDDKSYAVDADLKNALKTYTTKLLSIQGDSAVSGGGDTGDGGDDDGDTGEIIEGDVVHNFTLSGKNSSFFNITGNLSDSKGTVNYGDLSLTQCLKIESSTLISFTTDKEASLTLVFNDGFAEEIKVNGTSYTASNGKLTVTIPAGQNEISKDDVANLYYMSVDYPTTTGVENMSLSGLQLYPNPVVDKLHLAGEEGIERVQIFNLRGAVVKTVLNSFSTIDMSNLKPGIYFVKFFTGDEVINRKIIKE